MTRRIMSKDCNRGTIRLLSRVIGYVISETGYVFSAASILLPNVRFTRMAMGKKPQWAELTARGGAVR